jgi:hypothetical protein
LKEVFMTPRTLAPDCSLIEIRAHVGFTLRRLRAQPLAAILVPCFENLLAEFSVVQREELELADKIDDAAALAAAVDAELNELAVRVSNAVLALTRNDRAHPLYQHFFKGKPVHAFNRPILGHQLEAMRQWQPLLARSEHPPLKALGSALPSLLEKADKTLAAKARAEHEGRKFREAGARKRYIDAVNAARREAHGLLATLPAKHAGLPSNFADRFFRRDRSKEPEAQDLEAVKASVSALRQELEAQEKVRDALEKEQEEARAKTDAAVKLAELQRGIEQKKREAAALQAALAPNQ